MNAFFDLELLRALAEASPEGWGGIRKSKGSAELARELGISEARAALGLKKMAQVGLCRPTSDRSLQIRYVITDAGEMTLGLRPAKVPKKVKRRRRKAKLMRRLHLARR